MEPTSVPDVPDVVDAPDATAPAGHTRRNFIRGIAASGASTAAAGAVIQATGITDLFADTAEAAVKPPAPLSEFRALAASSADELQVPEGFRAYTLIGYGDEFANTDGTVYRYGYNNDYLAFFPLDGSDDEGLLFINHEYPAPFFQSGYKTGTKSATAIHEEIESVGNSILHVKRGDDQRWEVVSPSEYNRRIFGGDVPGMPDTPLDITGPLAGTKGSTIAAGVSGPVTTTGRRATIAVGTRAKGTVGNCSGGITPWGTALSCEENYDSYGYPAPGGYGWGQVDPDEYDPTTGGAKESQLYGWVCEHDPYDPSFVGRKHTALGRFRHENTAFRAEPNKPFVLYMGDDQTNQAVYKFVSTRKYLPESRYNNLKILTEGTLYVARWAPEGRRRFNPGNLVDPITPTEGTGEWVKVEDWELYDTRLSLGGFFSVAGSNPRRTTYDPTATPVAGTNDPTSASYSGRFNFINGDGVNEWDTHFATNRPEDVEVDVDGTVYIAFTNNSGVNDQHGAIRRLVEAGNDPTATTFTWADFAEGGPSRREDAGEQGFSSCDNLVIDKANNVWTVTDISSSSLKGARQQKAYYEYHGNNAVFMIPRSGPNKGVAFRFANMPVEAEGTGPYFTPDEKTLFINVQHPGEDTPDAGGVYGNPATYTSWWPAGNKTAGINPSTPVPTTVAIERVPEYVPDAPPQNTIPTPPTPAPPAGPGGAGGGGATPPAPPKPAATVPATAGLASFLTQGTLVTIQTTAPGTIVVRLSAKLPRVGRRGTATVTIARAERRVTKPGTYKVRVKPGRLMRARLRAATKGKSLTATVTALVPGTKQALKDRIRLRG